jgi:hypothetical protein
MHAIWLSQGFMLAGLETCAGACQRNNQRGSAFGGSSFTPNALSLFAAILIFHL